MPGPVLSQGSAEVGADPMRQEQELAATWVEEFLRGGYGPHGGAKLLAQPDGEATWIESPALALAEAPSAHPALQPYRDLARRVQADGGDQATAAVLLAARLVRSGLSSGLPRAALLDGLRLARRQALGTLESLRQDATAAAAIGHVAEDGRLAATIVDGLTRLGRDVDLDAVDVRAEPREAPAWSPGLVAMPQTTPSSRRGGRCGVLLLASSWTFKPRADGAVLRVKDAAQHAAWLDAEDALRRRAADHLARLGVGFVACTGAIDDGLLARLASQGLLVWTSCPTSAVRRLARATGARDVADAMQATAAEIGQAAWSRRDAPLDGWLVEGHGAAATVLVPADSKPARDAAVESAERMLRAAGRVLASPGALPGGGRWQRDVAGALRRSADAAPGKSPLVLRLAADAVDALADDLVANAGEDPLDVRLLKDAPGVLDPAACVRLALTAAFDAATMLLRLDGRYAKRGSSPAALRGGHGRAGSPRGMPGDNPPLM